MKAASGQILKNNNCCFFEQDLAYSSNTLYASFYADFCCCGSISFLKTKLNLKVEEICREKSTCSHKFLGKKCHRTRFLFSIIYNEAFSQNSQPLNTVIYFCKKLHFRCLTEFWIGPWLSLSFLLLLSIEAVTLNLPIILLMWFVFYISISSRNLLCRCNRIMFETCRNLPMRDEKGFDKVVLVSFLLTWNMFTRGKGVSTSENPALKCVYMYMSSRI